MEAVRRLTSRFGAAVPVLLLATGGFETQTPSSASSGSGSSDMRVIRKNYWRFSSVAAAEWPSSQEPLEMSFWSSLRRLPEIVKAGDPVLHERACEVDEREITSKRVQKIIDDMILVMREITFTYNLMANTNKYSFFPIVYILTPSAPGYSLSAPQIGIPSRIIVLEYKKEWNRRINYHSEEEIKAQDRRPFDLLVIVNPKLMMKSNETALAIESSVSVEGYAAVVERNLDVEVTGFDRYGEPIKINASGYQARILQHACDHLDGILYVDKMVPGTFFRTKRT